MWDIIITDLIPIYIVMLGGYLSGKRNIFKKGVSVNFNKLVLNYCLPSALFVSIVKADRHMLFEDGRLSAISLIVIVGLYFWTFFSCKKFFKHTTVEASVSGLIGGAPTIG